MKIVNDDCILVLRWWRGNRDVSIAVFLFPSVGAVARFSFIGVATWAEARRKEREAYYKGEVLKKIAETQGATSSAALDYLREEERVAVRRQREGLKLGGLITAAAGIGLMVFFGAVVHRNDRGIIFIGAIPLLIGVALMLYAYLLGRRSEISPLLGGSARA